MFIKLSENIQKTQPLKRVYRGKVVDNADPDKLMRVKVEIKGIFEGDPASLPWVFPRNEFFLGGSANSGKVSVPEVDSELEVRFPFEDIYSPFYYGYWTNNNTKHSDFDADYPESYGFKDSSGNKMVINKTQQTLKFDHSSGIIVDMAQDGTFTLTISKDLFENVTGDYKLTGSSKYDLDITGDIFIKTGTQAVIEAVTEFFARADLIKLGQNPSFHATIAESMVAGHDSHIHPPHPPLLGGPILPPVVLLSDKAGTALDVTALKIIIQGNT